MVLIYAVGTILSNTVAQDDYTKSACFAVFLNTRHPDKLRDSRSRHDGERDRLADWM